MLCVMMTQGRYKISPIAQFAGSLLSCPWCGYWHRSYPMHKLSVIHLIPTAVLPIHVVLDLVLKVPVLPAQCQDNVPQTTTVAVALHA
jgi:hypothetical protein